MNIIVLAERVASGLARGYFKWTSCDSLREEATGLDWGSDCYSPCDLLDSEQFLSFVRLSCPCEWAVGRDEVH